MEKRLSAASCLEVIAWEEMQPGLLTWEMVSRAVCVQDKDVTSSRSLHSFGDTGCPSSVRGSNAELAGC